MERRISITDKLIHKGDVFLVDFGMGVGSVQSGVRPAVVVQNNTGNKYSPTILVAPLTSRTSKPPLPTHVTLYSGEAGLRRDSVVLTEQIQSIDRSQMQFRIGALPENAMQFVNKALTISFAI